jgi:hypothetical protein
MDPSCNQVSPDNMGWLLAARNGVVQARIVLAFVESRLTAEYHLTAADTIAVDGAIQRATTPD